MQTLPTCLEKLPEAARRLLAYWTTARGETVVPDATALNPAALREWISDCSIVELHSGEKQLHLRMQGVTVAKNIGDYYAPGGYLEDLIPEGSQGVVLEPYYKALRTRCPVFSVIGPGRLAGRFDQFERLILPFSDPASGQIDRFLVWVGPTNRDVVDCETIYEKPLSSPSMIDERRGIAELMVIE